MAGVWKLFILAAVLPCVTLQRDGLDKREKSTRETYHGKIIGSCEKSGFYYYDSESYLVCANGAAYRQPCAPGTRNSGYNKFTSGDDHKAHDFCDENLVSRGYVITEGFHRKHFPKSVEVVFGTTPEPPELRPRERKLSPRLVQGKEFDDDLGVSFFRGPAFPSPFLAGGRRVEGTSTYSSGEDDSAYRNVGEREPLARSGESSGKSQEEIDYQKRYGLERPRLSRYSQVYQPSDMDHAFGYISSSNGGKSRVSDDKVISEARAPLDDVVGAKSRTILKPRKNDFEDDDLYRDDFGGKSKEDFDEYEGFYRESENNLGDTEAFHRNQPEISFRKSYQRPDIYEAKFGRFETAPQKFSSYRDSSPGSIYNDYSDSYRSTEDGVFSGTRRGREAAAGSARSPRRPGRGSFKQTADTRINQLNKKITIAELQHAKFRPLSSRPTTPNGAPFGYKPPSKSPVPRWLGQTSDTDSPGPAGKERAAFHGLIKRDVPRKSAYITKHYATAYDNQAITDSMLSGYEQDSNVPHRRSSSG